MTENIVCPRRCEGGYQWLALALDLFDNVPELVLDVARGMPKRIPQLGNTI
jgi:hypothetical protein